MPMHCSTFSSTNAAKFLTAATNFWQKDPIYNNLQWALAQKHCHNQDFKAAILTNKDDTWVAIQTANTSALILHGPDQLSTAGMAFFKDVFKVAKGIISSRVLCNRLAEFWGLPIVDSMPMLLYRLDATDLSLKFTGQLEPWTTVDQNLLAVWLEAFADAINEAIVGRDFMERAEEMIDLGHIWLLRVNGEIVSMAGSTRSIGGVACVNYVFTPENLRGNGYAYSCVGLLSAQLLQTHNSCCLYAEEAYLASNRVYQKLGYRVVGRTKEVTFNTNH